MQLMTRVDVSAAERFVWISGRLLDRRRFDHLFRGGPADAVVEALRPYRNADGRFSDPMVAGVCDWLVSVTRPHGGVPFVLPSVRTEPRAPWWDTGDEPPGALNPTASLAGLLHAHGVDHAWLGPASDFCWREIDRLDELEGYSVRAILLFLDFAPERARAERAAERLRDMLAASDAVELEPGARRDEHVLRPLDIAPRPGPIRDRLFTPRVIDLNLVAIAEGQQEDGGWAIDFPAWALASGPEWRGHATIGALSVLRAHEH
jgi:hypothetical protein